ncbi:MAG TPA: hypothetical protein VEN82_04805 [Actinomycetota bacterium]|nr:hypothetical protein [Actinomycetota bacterium]
MSKGARSLAVVLTTAVLAGLVAFYVVGFLRSRPTTVAASEQAQHHVTLALQTVASLGFGPHPDWVSYLIKNDQGRWVHSTVFTVPANSLVTLTIYQYDTATGLRNPFWGKPQGVVGGTMVVNGKTLTVLDPDLASHTFAIPDLGVSVPLMGVADDAPNQCSVAPCTLAEAHTTVTFTFRTGARGTFRWQCFVPCAAGFIGGFGGPMQTIGYMDGFVHVV